MPKRPVGYLEGIECCLCGGKNTGKNFSGSLRWHIHKCSKRNCTGRICDKCQKRIEYNIEGSYENVKKLRADWRNGNLDPLSSIGKGFIGQQIISRTYKIDDCNLKMDNFNFYIDLTKDAKYGYGEVKIATLNIRDNWWIFNISMGQTSFDTLFLLCMDNNEPWKNIERVYVIKWQANIGYIYIETCLN